MASVKREPGLPEVLDDKYCSEVAKKVFKILQFPVDVDIIKSNGPEFANILLKLTEKLGKGCVGTQSLHDLKQETEVMKNTHQKFLAHKIFSQELMNIVTGCVDLDTYIEPETEQYFNDIRKAVALGKAKQMLAENPEKLKLSKQVLQFPVGMMATSPVENKKEEEKLVMILRRRFQRRCEELLEIVYDANNDECLYDATENIADVAKILPEMVSESLLTVEKEKRNKWDELYKHHSILKYYQDVQIACADSLTDVARKVRGKDFETNCEYLLVKCDACLNKIKLLDKSVQLGIYSGENAEALTKCGQCLDEELMRTEEELTRVKYMLNGYLKLGAEYEKTVKEFSELRRRIREKRWTIAEIEKQDAGD